MPDYRVFLRNIGFFVLGGIFVGFPFISFAQPEDFSEGAELVVNILNQVIVVLVGVGVFVFLWGILKYIGAGADEKARSEGKNFIVYGILGIFVMISIWGFVNILSNTFFFSSYQLPSPRQIPISAP